MKHRQDAIRGLALLAENASPGQLPEILTNSDYLLDDFDTGLAFFSPDGSLERYTGDQQFWEGMADRVRPVIRDLLEQNKPPVLISSAYINSANQEKMVLVLAASPERNLVAAGASSAAELVRHTLTSSFASGSEASAVVVDANKDVLYQGGSFSYSEDRQRIPGSLKPCVARAASPTLKWVTVSMW